MHLAQRSWKPALERPGGDVDGSIIGGMFGLIAGMLGGLAATYVMARLRARRLDFSPIRSLPTPTARAKRFACRRSSSPNRRCWRGATNSTARWKQSRKELRDQERRLEKRADLLDQKFEIINKKEREFEAVQRFLAEQQEDLQRRQGEIKQIQTEQRDLLQRISRLAPEEARATLLRQVEEELRGEFGSMVLRHEATVRDACQQKAREILTTTIQRYAASHTAEVTVSTVDIPSDEMKGRIIGREGRNIRAFEKATGVDVIVDDTPGVVVVTGFDSIRREIAKISLEKLIQDGRIHPTRIEEIVTETQEEMERHIRKIGQEAAEEAGVIGLHEKLLDYLGRLKFRTSYSQNVLRHSIEVAFLTGMMAEELGLSSFGRTTVRALARYRQGGRPRNGRGTSGRRCRAYQAIR